MGARRLKESSVTCPVISPAAASPPRPNFLPTPRDHALLRRVPGLMAGLACWLGAATAAPTAVQAVDPAAFHVVLERYCIECHGAEDPEEGLDLTAAAVLEDPGLLDDIADRLRRRSMPPSRHEAQPTEEQREAAVAWLEHTLDGFFGSEPDPGRVAIRRLTRTDYRNTVRDLLDLEVDVSGFPSDDIAHGFDNLAGMISLPPLLMERYGDAAESLARRWFEREFADWQGAAPGEGAAADELVEVDDETRAAAMAAARERLLPLASRAFRRPLTEDDEGSLLHFVRIALDEGWGFDGAVQAGLQRILLSPAFLFRIEQDGPIGQDVPIRGHELATRLSYFLWSSMPDEELLALAEQEKLHDPGVLRAQVERMLADPRVGDGLVGNFGGQWLQISRIDGIGPNPERFPGFDDELRAAMRTETELLWRTVVQEGLPITTLLDADFTHVNARLARHYGLEGVDGDGFRRVSLEGTPRRGLLTHASVLATNSHPTRTSPVKRGKWILEAILGDPPPPPVPDAAELSEVDADGTLRERLEQHRADPRCASCHVKMDALGLAFEHYDAIGGWRSEDEGFPVDASGELDSQAFTDASELLELLRRDYAADFRHNLVRQLFIYGLGRTIDRPDRDVIDVIVRNGEMAGDRLVDYLAELVASDPFLMRRNPARIGLAQLPDSLDFTLGGNPEQFMRLTFQPADGVEPVDGPQPFELHSLQPLLRAVVPGRDEDLREVELGDAGPDERGVHRYRLEAAAGEQWLLFFMPGLLAPGEYSEDFLMPVATVPVTEEPAVLDLASHNARWDADLHTPGNARPGTLYSFDFQARLTGMGVNRDNLHVWLTNAGATNNAAFTDSGAIPIEVSREMQTFTQVGRRTPGMVGSWSESLQVAIRARADLVVADVSPIRFIRPAVGLEAPDRVVLRPGGESGELVLYNSQRTTLTDHQGDSWVTVLYGATNIHRPEGNQEYHLDIDHAGVILVGAHADRFELVADHLDANGGVLLQREDGEFGLRGGEDPDRLVFRVRHREGRALPDGDELDARIRIVTQAGGFGTLSAGDDDEGEPPARMYYHDIPVQLRP